MSKLLGLFLFVSLNAMALPLPRPGHMQIPPTMTPNYDFEGIAALSNCSGSLVRWEDSQDTDAAMILTNGHCLGAFIDPGEIVYGQPTNRPFTLLKSDGREAGRVNADLVIYGTMTKTDLALYRLRESYAQIKSRLGIRPLTLAKDPAPINQPIEVISGYWRRGYNCQVEAMVYRLKEGEWTWESSMRYSRPGCEVIGGTSGSPVIASGSRIVVGVNNTGNEDGERCTDNNPCEIDENGNVHFVKGFSYAQQTLWLYSCLNNQKEVDLQQPNCQLPH